MMNTLCVLTVLLALGSALQLNVSPELADQYLQDKVFTMQQLKCVVGTGFCDVIGNMIKADAVEVLTNNCAKCTASERYTSDRVWSYVRQYYPAYYNTIYNMYVRRG
uniref:Chemosensory protein 7 n=1 Tax=Matsumurasca onukii TaxID=2912585 RepID=A0A343WGZ6_MATON|nr:chemosensory protein 7 [Matsumurasca onukii]